MAAKVECEHTQPMQHALPIYLCAKYTSFNLSNLIYAWELLSYTLSFSAKLLIDIFFKPLKINLLKNERFKVTTP